jgi:hypothetical protein
MFHMQQTSAKLMLDRTTTSAYASPLPSSLRSLSGEGFASAIGLRPVLSMIEEKMMLV